MADMELVIKIPEEIDKYIRSTEFYIPGSRSGKSLLEKILKAIRTGTPLPAGHGRLIDADNMKTMKNIQSANFNAVELIRLWIDNQSTIIEADNTESEVKG